MMSATHPRQMRLWTAVSVGILQCIAADIVESSEDFWTQSDASNDVYRCLEPGVCLGGPVCRHDRAGPLCSSCAAAEEANGVVPGIFGGHCKTCTDIDNVHGWGSLVGFVLVLALLAIPWSAMYTAGECVYNGSEDSETAVDAFAQTARAQACLAWHIACHGVQLAALSVDAARVASPGGLGNGSSFSRVWQGLLALAILDARPLAPDCVLGIDSGMASDKWYPPSALALSWLLPPILLIAVLCMSLCLRALRSALRALIARKAVRHRQRLDTDVVSPILPQARLSDGEELQRADSDQLRPRRTFTQRMDEVRTRSTLFTQTSSARAIKRRCRIWRRSLRSLARHADESPLIAQPLTFQACLQALRAFAYLFCSALVKLSMWGLECAAQPGRESIGLWAVTAGELVSCSEGRRRLLGYVCPLIAIYLLLPLLYLTHYFCGGVAREVQRFEEKQERALRVPDTISEESEVDFPHIEGGSVQGRLKPSLLLLQAKPEMWLWPVAVLLRNSTCAMAVGLLGSGHGGMPSLWLMFFAQLLYLVFLLRKWPWASPRLNRIDAAVSVMNLLVVVFALSISTAGAALILGRDPEKMTSTMVMVALVVLLVILCIQCIVLVSARRRMGNLGDIERKDNVDKMDLAADLMKLSLHLCAVDHATYRAIINTLGRDERQAIQSAVRVIQDRITDASNGGVVEVQRRVSFQRITREWMKEFEEKSLDASQDFEMANSQDLAGLESILGPSRKASMLSINTDIRKAPSSMPSMISSPSAQNADRRSSTNSLASMRDILGWHRASSSGPSSPVQQPPRQRVHSLAFLKTWGPRSDLEGGNIADLPGGGQHGACGGGSPSRLLGHRELPRMITGMADLETDGQDYKALMEQMLEESHRRRVELGRRSGRDTDQSSGSGQARPKEAWAADEATHLGITEAKEELVMDFSKDELAEADAKPETSIPSLRGMLDTQEDDAASPLDSPASGVDGEEAKQRWQARRAKRKAQRDAGKVNYGNMLRQMRVDKDAAGGLPTKGTSDDESLDFARGSQQSSVSSVASSPLAGKDFADERDYKLWLRRNARKLHERYQKKEAMREEAQRRQEEEQCECGSKDERLEESRPQLLRTGRIRSDRSDQEDFAEALVEAPVRMDRHSSDGSYPGQNGVQELQGLRQCIIDQLPNLSSTQDQCTEMASDADPTAVMPGDLGFGPIPSALPAHSGLTTVQEVSGLPSRQTSKPETRSQSADFMAGGSGSATSSWALSSFHLGQRGNRRLSLTALSEELQEMNFSGEPTTPPVDLSRRAKRTQTAPGRASSSSSAESEESSMVWSGPSGGAPTSAGTLSPPIEEEEGILEEALAAVEEEDEEEEEEDGGEAETCKERQSGFEEARSPKERLSIGEEAEVWVDETADKSATAVLQAEMTDRLQLPQGAIGSKRPSKRVSDGEGSRSSQRHSFMDRLRKSSFHIEAKLQGLADAAQGFADAASGKIIEDRRKSQRQALMPPSHRRRTSVLSPVSPQISHDFSCSSPASKLQSGTSRVSVLSTNSTEHAAGIASGDWLLPQESMLRFVTSQAYKQGAARKSFPSNSLSMEQVARNQLGENFVANRVLMNPGLEGMNRTLSDGSLGKSSDSDNTIATAQMLSTALDDIAKDRKVDVQTLLRQRRDVFKSNNSLGSGHTHSASAGSADSCAAVQSTDGQAHSSSSGDPHSERTSADSQDHVQAGSPELPGVPTLNLEERMKAWRERKEKKRQKRKEDLSARTTWNRTYGSMVHLEAKAKHKTAHSANPGDAESDNSDDASSAYSGRSTGSSDTLQRAAPANLVSNRSKAASKSFPATSAEETSRRRWCTTSPDKRS